MSTTLLWCELTVGRASYESRKSRRRFSLSLENAGTYSMAFDEQTLYGDASHLDDIGAQIINLDLESFESLNKTFSKLSDRHAQ